MSLLRCLEHNKFGSKGSYRRLPYCPLEVRLDHQNEHILRNKPQHYNDRESLIYNNKKKSPDAVATAALPADLPSGLSVPADISLHTCTHWVESCRLWIEAAVRNTGSRYIGVYTCGTLCRYQCFPTGLAPIRLEAFITRVSDWLTPVRASLRTVVNITLAAASQPPVQWGRSTSIPELSGNQSATLHLSLPVPDFVLARRCPISVLCIYGLPCGRAVTRTLSHIEVTPQSLLTERPRCAHCPLRTAAVVQCRDMHAEQLSPKRFGRA
jgi:hypothetical protein